MARGIVRERGGDNLRTEHEPAARAAVNAAVACGPKVLEAVGCEVVPQRDTDPALLAGELRSQR